MGRRPVGGRYGTEPGRVSFNPIRHADPFGTFVLPGMMLLFGSPFVFGWAKPVPVAFHRLRHPKRDMIWVALAGPGINIVMALLAGVLAQIVGQMTPDRLHCGCSRILKTIDTNIILASSICCRFPHSTVAGC